MHYCIPPPPPPLSYLLIETDDIRGERRWELMKENKKVRKKERKHALDQESDQEKTFLDKKK